MSPQHASATDTIQIYLFNCVHSNWNNYYYGIASRARTILYQYTHRDTLASTPTHKWWSVRVILLCVINNGILSGIEHVSRKPLQYHRNKMLYSVFNCRYFLVRKNYFILVTTDIFCVILMRYKSVYVCVFVLSTQNIAILNTNKSPYIHRHNNSY